MPQRNYTAPQFGVQDNRELQRFQVNGTDTRIAPTAEVGDSQWRDRLLQDIEATAGKVLNKAADVAFSEQYLEGQAAAGVIQSEEELQGNPLTRDWQVAGYRDTMGKLALADAQASFMQDLPDLRTKGPEELQSYLNARRQKLMPALAGMSLDARTAVAGQLLLQDRDATRRWTSERMKYIIDQKSQAINTQWAVVGKGLADAQLQSAIGDLSPENFQESVRQAAGTIVGSVWSDKTLPHEIKRNLTFEMIQSALANDSVALYDYLRDNPIPDDILAGADGKATTLLSRLEGDQQTKLANAYREARNRTAAARDMLRSEQVANLEAQIDAEVYTGSYDDVKAMLDPMLLNKSITGEKRQAIINKFLDKSYKRDQRSDLAGAALRGDVQSIIASGKGIDDAVRALETQMGMTKLPLNSQIQSWVRVGRNGINEGYKKVGEYLGVSIRQMVDSKDGTILPQHAETFRTINNVLREAEREGLGNTRTNVLSGLPENDRMFAEQVMRRVDDGASLDEAVQLAKKVHEQDSSLTPSARAARASTTAKAIAKDISAIEPRGILETVWNEIKGIVSQDAQNTNTITPLSTFSARDNFFGDSPTVQFYVGRTRDELRVEADNISMLHPSASADEVMTVAKANVAARTIQTSQGPVILPRNTNIQQVFGVGAGNQAAIGKAIDSLLQTNAGGRWQVAFVQGRMFAQEFDGKGTRIGTGKYIEPSAIRAKIAEQTNSEVSAASERFGAGKIVQADGVTLRFNGINNAGVSPDWMFGFRNNLVNNESVKSTVYKDTVGVNTVGVGVSERSKFYPKSAKSGKVSEEDIRVSFMDASNEAAIVGSRVMQNVGLDNKAAFSLFSELAYQSGPNFLGQQGSTGDAYRNFAASLRSRDAAKAVQLFQNTAAYKLSGAERRAHYISLIEQSLKG